MSEGACTTTPWVEVAFTKKIKDFRKRGDWSTIENLSKSQETDFHSIYYAESLMKQERMEEGKKILLELEKKIKRETADDYFILGKIERLKNNDDEAFKFYKISAEMGSGDAQHNLSIYYERGTGTVKDKQKAFFWMLKAAENNLVDSQFNSAVAYEEGGETNEKNDQLAFYWYSRAAENNDPESSYYLGEYYERGIGTEKNLDEAYRRYCGLLECEDERVRNSAAQKVELFRNEGITLIAHYDRTKMYMKLRENNESMLVYSDVIIGFSK